MKDRYTRVTAPAGFDGQATRRDYYFKTRNAARDFRLRIKRWKAEQKYPADTLSFDDSDKRWLAYLRAHVGNHALRHSYASYWLARSSKEGLGELSKRMGNSEAVCKRHYLETLTREEGKSWFALRRSTGAP